MVVAFFCEIDLGIRMQMNDLSIMRCEISKEINCTGFESPIFKKLSLIFRQLKFYPNCLDYKIGIFRGEFFW